MNNYIVEKTDYKFSIEKNNRLFKNMETLITIINFLIFILILVSPILILKRLKKNILLNYSLISLSILGILILTFAWWSYKSDLILLNHYGYNIDGMNHNEFYGNVTSENMEKVKSLETSIMGIGWPLKAMFEYVAFIPYLIFVYIGKIIIDRIKNKKTLPNTV